MRAAAHSRFLLVAAAVLLLTFASTSFASAQRTQTLALPLPEKLPANTVAVVGHVAPAFRTVTAAKLRRAVFQTAALTGPRSFPEHVDLRNSALGELLDAIWIRGQAHEMGIAVRQRDVSAELAAIKAENFKGAKQFRAYLRHAHLTLGEVRERVELQLMSRTIRERIVRKAAGEKDAGEAFSEFVAAYQERWRSRTVCAAEYVIDRCSNGPAPE